MKRKTANCLVLIATVCSIVYVMLYKKMYAVDIVRVAVGWRADTVVAGSCPQHFMQNHYMTINQTNGRTGNNLFRLLALIGTARKYCYTPVLDKKKFSLLNATIDLSMISDPPQTDSHWNIMDTGVCCIYPTRVDILNTTFNWTLNGFMQSWRYMQGQEEYIRSVIKFREDTSRKASNYLQGLRRQNDFGRNDVIVCIHIRRGDFMRLTHRGYSTSDLSYINKSMTYYGRKFGESKVKYVMISDDMKWVKANIAGSDVYYSEGRSATLDMAILSLCNHSIITGGTFGYIGAWLSGGSVVYDSSFPKPGSWLIKRFNTTDYYPRSWIRM